MKTLLVILGLSLLVAGCGGASDSGPESAAGAGQRTAAGQNAEEFVEATAAEHAGDSPEASPAADAADDVPLLEQELAYGEAEGANLTGFLAMPRNAIEPLPGVIVIHEWWGLNDNMRAMTRRLAAEGYIALAVDLYGDAVAEEPARAQELMSRITASPEAVQSNLRQASEYLSEYALSPRVGVIGWCLGGGWALQTALMLPDEIDATVMYYGRLEFDEERLSRLSSPLLGSFAELDESIPVQDVRRFRNRLREMGKNTDIYIYLDERHAFANPSGGNYDAEAAEHAWNRTVGFLERYLK